MWFQTIVAALSIAVQAGGYSGVPADHWAAKSIDNLVTMRMLPAGEGKPFQGDQPVTRYEFALLMDRFVTDIRKAFLRQPNVKTINEANIKGRAQDGSQAAMLRLAKESFLPYASPIFRGPKDTISPDEMAIAMAQIAQKIASLFRLKDDETGGGN